MSGASSTAGCGPLLVALNNWVGEVVLSLPALRRLAAAGYTLELVGKPWAVPLLEGHGWPVHVRPARLRARVRQLRALRARLAHDSARFAHTRPMLVMTRSLSSALAPWLAGLKAAGYRADGRSLLLAAAYPRVATAHAALGYWNLVSQFLGAEAPFPAELALEIAPRRIGEARTRLAAEGLAPGGYAVLCPFSGADDRERRKVWPGFADLNVALLGLGLRTLVCPGPGEEQRAREQCPGALVMTGVDLGLYAALLRAARCVIANDTGPGHLAAAAGARLVAVYGPQSVAAWAPLGARVTLLHPPAGWASTADVLEAALA